MDNYLDTSSNLDALNVAVSYLGVNTYEWWMTYSQLCGGKIQVWEQLKEALLDNFESLNKEKATRDRLVKLSQAKDVLQFNHDFQRIFLDILDKFVSEQANRYTNRFKPYIWKEIYTIDYDILTDMMRDTERIEVTHRKLKSIA